LSLIQASGCLRDAADQLSGSSTAVHLRFLQTLVRISSTKNHTLVVPIPVEIVRKVVAMARKKK
jgi:hypothetical protein